LFVLTRISISLYKSNVAKMYGEFIWISFVSISAGYYFFFLAMRLTFDERLSIFLLLKVITTQPLRVFGILKIYNNKRIR
jgi:drug/metabolite transporter (DMT)-like permease